VTKEEYDRVERYARDYDARTLAGMLVESEAMVQMARLSKSNANVADVARVLARWREQHPGRPIDSLAHQLLNVLGHTDE